MKTQKIISLALLGLLSSPMAHAFSDGSITGAYDGGCDGCHAGSGSTSVSISGPNSITIGDDGVYTVRVTTSNAGATHYGLNFGIFQGLSTTFANAPLNLGAGLQIDANEITFLAPIPLSNTATFTWFPDTAGTYTIRGMANAVNMDGTPDGDTPGLANPFTVVVSAVTTTTTAATTTTAITAPPSTGLFPKQCWDAQGNMQVFYNVVQCPAGWSPFPPSTVTTTTSGGTGTTTSSAATTTTIKTDKYTKPSNLPAAAEYCGYCHGLTVGKWRIADAPYAGAPTRHKPAGMKKDKWKRIINKMVKKEGCPVPTAEVGNLASYYSSLKR